MEVESLYTIISEQEVILPGALSEKFLEFVAQSGIHFAPLETVDGENSRFRFLMAPPDLNTLVQEFFALLEPDNYAASEMAVPNERIKHVERVARESGWLCFIRQHGGKNSRICFIRTGQSIPAAELEERVELVS